MAAAVILKEYLERKQNREHEHLEGAPRDGLGTEIAVEQFVIVGFA